MSDESIASWRPFWRGRFILAISALAVAGRRIPAAVLWISFAVHVSVTALFALFMFTFKMDRMM